VASTVKKETVGHFVWNAIVLVLFLGIAVGLAYFEDWCIKQQLPDHLCFGIKVVSIVFFTIDAIFACGMAAIVTYKLLKKAVHNDD
jgi:hypothetical protein